MLPNLDPARFSALFGVAVVQALVAVALFSSLQYGPALKVYFSGSLVEVGAVVGVVVVEVEVEVEVEVVVEVAWAMQADKVEVGSGVGCNCTVGCYDDDDDVVGCYYNIDDDDDEFVGLGVLVRLMGAGPLEVGVVVLVMLVELMGVLVVVVVVMGLMQAVLELLEELAQALLGLVVVLVGLWFASFRAPILVLAAVVEVGVVHH